MKLEDLQPDATVRGILHDALVTVVKVEWHGADVLTLVYRGPDGRVVDEILYRHDEPRLEGVEAGRPWSFDGDGALFRLAAEAHRIRLAHLLDPVLAVHTSLVDPLPHQITEVRGRRIAWIDKTRGAVKERLTKEIAYWDHRAEQLKLQEQAGKAGARLNSQEARRRADDLQARLHKRLAELDREARISALPSVVLGGES